MIEWLEMSESLYSVWAEVFKVDVRYVSWPARVFCVFYVLSGHV